jgi:hypothetical protein
MDAKDNALNFVGQIMKAYNAAEKARGTALKYAIECGEYLNLAKENVIAAKGKGKWKSWLTENCPDVHQTTAELYMRLAKNKNKIADCKSVRDADLKLRQPSTGSSNTTTPDNETADKDETADEDDEGGGNSQRVVTTPQGASEDLTSLLENCAVDEIGKALRDADKLDEFETALITRMTPDKVCDALTQAWKVDEIIVLYRQLAAYLNEQEAKGKAPPNDASNRRPVVTQASSH